MAGRGEEGRGGDRSDAGKVHQQPGQGGVAHRLADRLLDPPDADLLGCDQVGNVEQDLARQRGQPILLRVVQAREQIAQTSPALRRDDAERSEEHTSELQSLMRISYAVFCLKKKKTNNPLLT